MFKLPSDADVFTYSSTNSSVFRVPKPASSAFIDEKWRSSACSLKDSPSVSEPVSWVVCYSEELCCAALTLVSQLVVEMVTSSCQVKTEGCFSSNGVLL